MASELIDKYGRKIIKSQVADMFIYSVPGIKISHPEDGKEDDDWAISVFDAQSPVEEENTNGE